MAAQVTKICGLESSRHACDLCEQAEVVANGKRVSAATDFKRLQLKLLTLLTSFTTMHTMAIKPEGATC